MKHSLRNHTPKLARLRRVSKPQLPKSIRRRLGREPALGSDEAVAGLPRITNETVAEHREEVLSSARKYIYPLQHSRGRIIKVSVSLFVAAVVLFFVYCGLALYKFQSNSTLLYEVTRVIPFPIARAGSDFVLYENYLFELRHYIHYYTTQQKVDPHSASGKQQLKLYKGRALQQVIDASYIKQVAADNHTSVTNREVDDEIALVKSQNRLGTTNDMLADVLQQFWGWSIDDFKRELKTQLLAQKVVSELDNDTHSRADSALIQLTQGADFAKVAAVSSDDATTKNNGGKYGSPISKTNRDVPPKVVEELFKLPVGQTSPVVDTGYTLEILKVLEVQGDKVQAAHMSFKFQPIDNYLKPLKAQHKSHRYIKV